MRQEVDGAKKNIHRRRDTALQPQRQAAGSDLQVGRQHFDTAGYVRGALQSPDMHCRHSGAPWGNRCSPGELASPTEGIGCALTILRVAVNVNTGALQHAQKPLARVTTRTGYSLSTVSSIHDETVPRPG